MSTPYVQRYLDIRMLRAMAIAAAPYRNQEKGHAAQTLFDTVKTQLKEQRQDQRRPNDPLNGSKARIQQEVATITSRARSVLRAKRVLATIHVGRRISAIYKKPIRGNEAELTITVGHMWLRRVWRNIYGSLQKDDYRLINHADYFILSAYEYRVSASQVRLWYAAAYSFADKEMVTGYIGQSKLGSQPCSFKRTSSMAIAAAQKLAALTVTKKIIGEI